MRGNRSACSCCRCTTDPVNVWDESFHLDELARSPIGGLNEVVPARSAQDGVVVFQAPAGRRNTVLNITLAEQTVDLTLGDLPASQPR